MANLYGVGAAIGFSPQQVDKMSVWQFAAAVNGYAAANAPPRKGQLSEVEKDMIFDWITRQPESPRLLTTQTYWLDGGRLVAARMVTFSPR
ncbi:MAG: hypothetical protein ACO1OK_00310 [Devosia sp.]